jgi:hypothetical protein
MGQGQTGRGRGDHERLPIEAVLEDGADMAIRLGPGDAGPRAGGIEPRRAVFGGAAQQTETGAIALLGM